MRSSHRATGSDSDRHTNMRISRPCCATLGVLIFGCRAAASPSIVAPDSGPDPHSGSPERPAEAEPQAARTLTPPADWWRSYVPPYEAPRWGHVSAGAELHTSAGSVVLEESQVSVLDTSSERALVALGVRPITLVGTVALEELERAFIVTRTPLQTGDGDPWITLESGAEVIPVTRHALEGDEAPVIFEGRLGCDDVTWQGTVPTAAIGRVVERSERTNTADVQPGVISTQIDLRSADGNTRLRLPTSSFDPLRAAASSFAEDGRVEVDIPFEDFTLNGWVDPGGFAPQTTALAPNPRCLEARPAADVPRPSERDAVLSLPEYTCLLGDDGSIAGVLSPPHVMMLSLGTGTSEDQAPGPTEVGAELVDEHRWRVWVPTLVGELSFIVAETGPSGGYRLCPPPTD